MTPLEDFVSAPNDLILTHPLSQVVHTMYDSFGEVMAEYTFFPARKSSTCAGTAT